MIVWHLEQDVEIRLAFCRMLKEKGVQPRAFGVEVISDSILARGVEEAARFNFENTKKCWKVPGRRF